MSATRTEPKRGSRKGLKVPHPFVILTAVVALMAILTHLIPAGAYDRVTNSLGVEVLNPDSFHPIDSTPVTLMQFLTSIPRGMWLMVAEVDGRVLGCSDRTGTRRGSVVPLSTNWTAAPRDVAAQACAGWR